jgi:hypothetical protein
MIPGGFVAGKRPSEDRRAPPGKTDREEVNPGRVGAAREIVGSSPAKDPAKMW